MPQASLTEIHLKMTYLKFNSNFPGVNELSLHMWETWSTGNVPEASILGNALDASITYVLLVVEMTNKNEIKNTKWIKEYKITSDEDYWGL